MNPEYEPDSIISHHIKDRYSRMQERIPENETTYNRIKNILVTRAADNAQKTTGRKQVLRK